jgi:hypothetical protein
MAGLRGIQQINCDGCGRLTPSYDIVSYGSMDQEYRQLCSRCFNTELAKSGGLDEFEHIQFEPVVLTDARGESHEFHFGTRLFGTGVSLEGFELRDGHPAGYRFQMIGDKEDALRPLLGRLIEKMRRALSVRHVEDSELGLQIAEHQTLVRGLIEYDEACDGRVPLLVIDGREITWEEFGRMLMTFEGWQFKLEIRDMSEEL